MRFLVDSSLPRSAAALLRRMGHEAVDVRDLMACTFSSPSTSPPCTPAKPFPYQYGTFLLPSRSGFYSNYYGGLRLRAFYGSSSFPGKVDVMVGQDEFVTGGVLHHPVLAVGANLPIGSVVRVFGAAYVALAKSQTLPSLILTPPSSSVNVSSGNVVIQQIQPVSQDYFRIGIGVDIKEVFKAIGSALSKGSSSTAKE